MARVASRPMPRSSSAGWLGLRAVTARGGAVNAAFLSGAEGLVLLQGLLATALLGPSAIGLYGVVTTTAMTIVALRRVGIDEAFVQQAADGRGGRVPARVRRSSWRSGSSPRWRSRALAPVLAAVYDDDRLLGAHARASPTCRSRSRCRRRSGSSSSAMDFLRLRMLQVIVPLGTVAVTVPLLLAGVGRVGARDRPVLRQRWPRWRRPGGPRPYRLRPRFDRAAARRYLRFSWPVFATAVAALAVAQGQVALFGLRRRARGRGLDHARGDAHALRRPRGPDPRHDDLPGDRARARPRRRARGAVRASPTG